MELRAKMSCARYEELSDADVPVELDHFLSSTRELWLLGASHEATRPWLQLARLIHLLGCAGLQSALLVGEAVALASPIGAKGLCSCRLCPVQVEE